VAGPEDEGTRNLPREQRQRTEERILAATRAAMVDQGTSVTIDEIAAVAGFSPRTIYRYFDTHDDLIAAGLRGMLKACEDPIVGLPSIDDDLDGWIDGIALASAARNASIFGAAFWDFARPTPFDSSVIEEARALRRPTRMQWMNTLADLAWTAAGGEGAPPPSVVTTLALALSAFTCHALAADFEYGPEEIARCTGSMIKDRLTAEVEEQRRFRESTQANT
jgi:AcrR family transcriptional regulator